MAAQCVQLYAILQATLPRDENSKILLQAQALKEAKDTVRSRIVLRMEKRRVSFFDILSWESLGVLSLFS